jgi:hypothetical protein
MITDQFFDWRNNVSIDIPEDWRNSYLRVYIWLTAHNYSVPDGLKEKVDNERR